MGLPNEGQRLERILQPGRSYWIKDLDTQKNNEIIKTLYHNLEDRNLIFITNRYPKHLKEDLGLTNGRIHYVWITKIAEGSEGDLINGNEYHISVTNTVRLASKLKNNFIEPKNRKKNVFVMDCLEYMILLNDTSHALGALSFLINTFQVSNDNLLILTRKNALEKIEEGRLNVLTEEMSLEYLIPASQLEKKRPPPDYIITNDYNIQSEKDTSHKEKELEK